MFNLFPQEENQFTIKDELVRRYGKEAAVDVFRNAAELAGWATGSRVCRFQAEVKEPGCMNHA